MKKMRRFAAIAAAAAMTACMAVPMMTAWAADETYSITITDNANGTVTASTHTFSAYQIFTGELNAAKNGFVGDSVTWGSAISGKEEAFITALKAATFSTDTETAMNALVAATDPEADTTQSTAYQVALAIEKANSSADATLLAKTIDSFVTANSLTGKPSSGGVISELTGGYYFVKDTTTITNGTSNAVSRFILKVTDNESVAIKTDAPKLIKKIWHNDTADAPTIGTTAPTYSEGVANAGWNDVGDNRIGDTVYYFIETTVPDMSKFDTYKYIIRDQFSDGLTMTAVTNIVYVPVSGTGVELYGEDGFKENVSFDIKIEDDKATTDKETFYVDFVDLKDVLKDAGIEWKKGDKIYTYYKAVLNENAQVSNTANTTQNNPNEAWLTYSKDANQSGSGDNVTNDTAHDIVYEWTYTFEAEKVDEANKPLPGATFKLTDANDTIIPLVAVTDLEKVTAITSATDTLYYRPAKVGEEGIENIVTTTTANKFVFIGLDDTKTYKLVEIDAPDDYTMAEPAKMVITNTYDTEGDEVKTIGRTVDGKIANKATIVNNKGTSLPSTGGIGTTLFYVIGGTLAAGAGVALIAKKRMKNEE